MSADISMEYDPCENCDDADTCHITGCKWDFSPIITDKEETQKRRRYSMINSPSRFMSVVEPEVVIEAIQKEDVIIMDTDVNVVIDGNSIYVFNGYLGYWFQGYLTLKEE